MTETELVQQLVREELTAICYNCGLLTLLRFYNFYSTTATSKQHESLPGKYNPSNKR